MAPAQGTPRSDNLQGAGLALIAVSANEQVHSDLHEHGVRMPV